jgi:hypothetical protein
MIYLVVGLIGGVLASVLASGKKRNPIGWFVIGFLLPLIGLILILVLPNGDGGVNVPMDVEPAAWPPPQPMASAQQAAQASSLGALEKLAELRDRGVLTPQEFEDKKKELLDRV